MLVPCILPQTNKQTNNIYMWHGTLESNSNQREELLKIIEMNIFIPFTFATLVPTSKFYEIKTP